MTRHTAGMTNKTIVDPDRLHEQAQNAALASLLRDDDVDALLAAIAPNDVPGTLWSAPVSPDGAGWMIGIMRRCR